MLLICFVVFYSENKTQKANLFFIQSSLTTFDDLQYRPNISKLYPLSLSVIFYNDINTEGVYLFTLQNLLLIVEKYITNTFIRNPNIILKNLLFVSQEEMQLANSIFKQEEVAAAKGKKQRKWKNC